MEILFIYNLVIWSLFTNEGLYFVRQPPPLNFSRLITYQVREMITNFHLYIVLLWYAFSDILVNAELLNTQGGEVYSLKIPFVSP